jgi:hypothetical protein
MSGGWPWNGDSPWRYCAAQRRSMIGPTARVDQEASDTAHRRAARPSLTRDKMAAMRAAWIVVALIACASGALTACASGAPPAPAAPKGPTACARASDSMVQTMLDRLPDKEAPPIEEADALRNLIRERCEQDGWSAEATRCLIATRSVDDAAACAPHLTDAQQAALVRDQSARFPAKGPASAAPAPPQAAPQPAPPTGSPPGS